MVMRIRKEYSQVRNEKVKRSNLGMCSGTGLVQLRTLTNIVNYTTRLSELIRIDIDVRCQSRTRRLVVSEVIYREFRAY